MNTFLVWILVTIGEHSMVSYSPPMETLVECQRVSQIVIETANPGRSEYLTRKVCIQMRIVK